MMIVWSSEGVGTSEMPHDSIDTGGVPNEQSMAFPRFVCVF